MDISDLFGHAEKEAMWMKEKLKKYLLSKHPNWLAAYDYFLKPSLKGSWGGPFNGQAGRQEIFRELISAVPFRAIVETGTFRGTTTEFLADSGLPVYTVEAEPRYFHYAMLRLRRRRNVHLESCDSRAFLEKLLHDPRVPKEKTFFYLDSHWGDDLPLKREVELIARHWRETAIMIDDFEVTDDSGYGFDRYSAGRKLSLEFLQPLAPLGLTAFFPSISSERETGRKRGCVVLADLSLTDRLTKLNSLRIAPTTELASQQQWR